MGQQAAWSPLACSRDPVPLGSPAPSVFLARATFREPPRGPHGRDLSAQHSQVPRSTWTRHWHFGSPSGRHVEGSPLVPPSSSCGTLEVDGQGESGQWLWRPCPHLPRARLLQVSMPSPSFLPPQEPVHTAPLEKKEGHRARSWRGRDWNWALRSGLALSAQALAGGRQGLGLLRGKGECGRGPQGRASWFGPR